MSARSALRAAMYRYAAQHGPDAGREQVRPLAEKIGPPPRTCQYPHGDPQDKGFHFCGEPVLEGSSYCPSCHSRCYRPLEPRDGRIGRLEALG